MKQSWSVRNGTSWASLPCLKYKLVVSFYSFFFSSAYPLLGVFSILHQGITLHNLRHLMTPFWFFFNLSSRTIFSGVQNGLGFNLGWRSRRNAILVSQNRVRGRSCSEDRPCWDWKALCVYKKKHWVTHLQSVMWVSLAVCFCFSLL